jgi:hypothetical protein
MAAPMVETWTGVGNLAGWGISGPIPESSTPAYGTLSNTGGTDLQVTGGNTPGVQEDFISASSGSLAGNKDYMTMLGRPIGLMSFDFYANADTTVGVGGAADLPDDLRLYFVSGNSGGSAWYYDLTPTVGVNGWTTYSVADFSHTGATAWYSETYAGLQDLAALQSALADVDQVGVWIQYNSSGPVNQEYGLDNFSISGRVPEPSTWAALGTALTSLAMTFRGRLNASLLRFWKSVRG